MGARKDVTEGWSTKNESATVGSGHLERQVRMTPRNDLEGERSRGSIDVGFHPLPHSGDVDSRDVLSG
jgi:hypothetical protein